MDMQQKQKTVELQVPEENIDAKMLRAAFARVPANLGLTIVVILVFVSLVGPFFPRSIIWAWIAVIVFALAVRLAIWVAFQRAELSPGNLKQWRRGFMVSSGIAGAAWGFGPTIIIPEAHGAEQALPVGTILCVCAVAIHTLAAQPGAIRAFVAAALLPPATSAWLDGGDVERVLAMVFLAGFVTIILVGRRSGLATRALWPWPTPPTSPRTQ